MSTSGVYMQTNGTFDNWFGSAGDDSYEGSDIGENFFLGMGNDILHAAGAADYIYADLGNDWFDGGSGSDTISFQYVATAGDKMSIAEFGVKFDLAKTTQDLGYWGTKTIYSIENVSGSENADKLYGNSTGNVIDGKGGSDYIDGRSGRESISGNLGVDTLVGGAGGDILGGNLYNSFADDGSRDYYRYSKTSESGLTPSSRDLIWGTFGGSSGDRIDLSRIDANGAAAGNGTFSFIELAGFHATSTGEVQVRPTGNPDEYMVRIDTDTDKGAEMEILVYSRLALTKSDFIL